MSKNRTTVSRVELGEHLSFSIDGKTVRTRVIHVAHGHCNSCGEMHCACALRANQAKIGVQHSIATCTGEPTQFESLALSATA